MKEFFDNNWALFWFVGGIVFIVFAFIAASNNQEDKSLACMAFSVACHARCEVKILVRKIEKLQEEQS